jgi:hypothetical protein
MREHEIDEFVIAPGRVAEVELGIGRPLFAQQRPYRDAHGRDQRLEGGAVGRRLEVFDDGRLDAAVADQPEHVARGAAGGVVVDGNVHGQLRAYRLTAAMASAT